MAARYYADGEAESKAFGEQTGSLPEEIGRRWTEYFKETESRRTKEDIVAKDADWLEQPFQAKEYAGQGHKAANGWINNVEKTLETESAKKILVQMKEVEFTDWYEGLKKMTYKKLDK